MHRAAGEVIGGVADIDAEAFDLDAHAAGEAGEAAVVAHAEFFFAQVIVSEADTEHLVAAQQEFPVKNEVAEKVVESGIAVRLVLFAAEQQGVVVLQRGVVVSDFPLVQVVGDHRESEGQVAQAFAESDLDVAGQVFPCAVERGDLGAEIAQHQGGGKAAGSISVQQAGVGGQGGGLEHVEGGHAEAQVEAERHAGRELPGAAEREGGFSGFYFSLNRTEFVGPGNVAVVHVLQAAMHREAYFGQMRGKGGVAPLYVRQVEIMLERQLPVHGRVQGAGIGGGEGHIVVAYGDLGPAQGGDPGRRRQGHKLEYVAPAGHLRGRTGRQKAEKQKAKANRQSTQTSK